MQPTRAEILTWFGSHPQPDGHCQSAGQSWSSQWWHQVSGKQKVGTSLAHWHCPPTFFPERGEQMRIPLLPRDKPQPPLSSLQACSVGGLVISLRPGTEAVVSHHYPGGRTRGYQISGGGRQVSLGRKSLRPVPRKIVNGLKGSPNQMQGSVGVNTCLYAPTQIILPSGN